jgi:thioredoxin-related protein
MKCPKSEESCPYWERSYIEMDKDQEVIHRFKEYLIEHFYMSRETANDVSNRFLEDGK